MVSLTEKNERKNRALAVIITLLIHAGLLLFLIYYIIVTPIPPYPEVATPELEVDFAGGGGGGSSAAAAIINRTNNAEEEHNKVQTKEVASNQPTVNSEAEPSTPIPSEKAIKQNEKIDTVPKLEEPSVELVNIENKFKSAKASGGGGGGGTGSGIGSGSGSGNGPGTGSGSGGGNGAGNGEGSGFGYDLKGRGILRRPELKYNSPEQGKIVVGITVDQDGNVIEATPGMVGSTITDATLYILVKNAAMKIKFTKSPDESPEQSGTVTFRFTIQ